MRMEAGIRVKNSMEWETAKANSIINRAAIMMAIGRKTICMGSENCITQAIKLPTRGTGS